MCPLKKGIYFALLVFMGIALHFAKGGEGANVSGQIYFTMPSVRLTVPIGGLPEGEPLLRVQASSDVPSNPSEGKRHPLISYRLVKPSQMLRLDPNSGYLFLSAGAKATEAASPQEQATNNQVEEAAIEMVPAVSASGVAVNDTIHMLVQIATLSPSNGKNTYCEDLPQQALCFWDSFSYAIMENRPATKLGGLRPPFLQQLCPHYFAFYSIVEGSNDHFQIFHSPEDNWYLHTKDSFDREVFEWVEVDVECHLNHSKDGSITRYQRRINVTILDEDDCPPNAQITELDININDPLVKKGDILNTGKLIMSDADTENVNIYKAEILKESDPPGLLRLNLHSWEVPARKRDLLTSNPSQIIPNVYESNSFGRTRSSAIHVGVSIAKTIKLTNPMYTTTFILKDTSLRGERDKAKVTITLRLMVASQEKFEKDVNGKNMGNEEDSRGIHGGAFQGWRGNISSFYPSTMTIQASTSHFARLAQPSLNPIYSLSARLYPHGSPFAITPKKGIIYLKDPSRLQGKSLFSITVKWGTNSSTASMTVKVEKSSVNCSSVSQTVTCASTSLRRTCESMCGLGANGFCSWRKSPKDLQQGIFSTEYSTCSPDLKTCPDGICDELEEIENKICPQDCARDFFGTVLQNGIEHNKGRGIKSGTGVCTCDDVLKCSCGPVTRGGKEKSTTAPENTSLVNTSNSHYGDHPHTLDHFTGLSSDLGGILDSTAKVNNHNESCGESCFIAVVLGIVAAFVIALAGAIYARRRRKLAKHGCHHLGMATAIPITIHPHDGTSESMAAATLGIQSQIYGQDDDGSQMQELPLLTLRTHHHPDMPIDPKWELPRSSLQLEETLGEGEFGLVLRGKLKSPYGQANRPTSPYITVAVKTLKEDAGEMERHALISEFKLLQSVNHPNVVRLIGACTVPRDNPFLLVIEYAELGSLRNYLRKSRLATSDTAPLQRIRVVTPPTNIHPKEACGGLITPRHILSFAWQISKGMAYLSEIKLVHRDLAARNVLLSSNGNCKISDFGLTRDIYEDDTYFKRSKGRVPVKWMAPESLSDHIYTTQSDVWGFGVLLWELVTLGSTPYPGVPLTGLYSLLRGGYRMQKPQNCSDDLYLVMLCCWKLEPRNRPTFQSLMASFERMLQDQVEYLQLGSIMAQNLTYFHSPTEETCPSPSDDRVQYGNIRHDPVTTDHEDNAVEVPATLTPRNVEPENATEKTVEYTWLWRGKRISKRRWEDMHGVDGKNLSQGLLSEIEELDEDSSGLDSTPKSESDPALNEDKTNNEDAAKDECPIKPTEQSGCTAMASPKPKISAESPF